MQPASHELSPGWAKLWARQSKKKLTLQCLILLNKVVIRTFAVVVRVPQLATGAARLLARLGLALILQMPRLTAAEAALHRTALRHVLEVSAAQINSLSAGVNSLSSRKNCTYCTCRNRAHCATILAEIPRGDDFFGGWIRCSERGKGAGKSAEEPEGSGKGARGFLSLHVPGDLAILHASQLIWRGCAALLL